MSTIRKFTFYGSLLLVLVSLGLILKVEIKHSTAQSGTLSPTISGVFPSQITWSVDNTKFVFQNHDSIGFGVNSSTQNWVQYDTETSQINYSNRWHLQPSLSATELQVFEPFTGSGVDTFIFQSPNNRYLVYGGDYVELSNADVWNVTVGDRQSNEVFDTSEFIIDPFSGPDGFKVIWSDDSNSFVIQAKAASGSDLRLIYFATNYGSSLSDMTLQKIEPIINDISYLPVSVYDISNDGSLILLNTLETNPENPDAYQAKIVVWNVINSSISEVINLDNGVIGATFRPNENSSVILINNSGLIKYDLISGQATLLDSTYSSSWIEQAVFSPNGEMVALVDSQETQISDIYIIDYWEDILSISPSNLRASLVDTNSIQIEWIDNSHNEDGFHIERSTGTLSEWVEINYVPADATVYLDSDISPSTTYYYRVRAYWDSNDQYSEYTNVAHIVTTPADPSQVTATISAPNQIQISWTDNSTDESGFRIERSPDSTAWEEIGTATAATYTDSTANPSTTYYYRVRAYRSSDNVFSDYSAASSGILSSPATPVSFVGVPLPINKAKLMWTDNTTDETNFRLERSDNGTSGWTEIVVAANQTTYTETRTTCIQTSYYRIRAYRGSDNQYSAYSPVVSVTTDGCGPDRLALFNTVHTHNRRFTDFPGTPYSDYWLNAPVASGRWVMGDWDGNGVDTPAVFNQDTNTFAFTNGTGATSTWVSMTLTVDGVPVAGRFNGNRANDCLGVVDDIPWGSDTAFALWFACDYTNLSPNIAELGYQWLGTPLANSAGYSSYGIHQFVTGDFDTDGVDTVAVRRGTTIAYGNTAPTTQIAAINLAQYFGNPYAGQFGGLYGILVAGDWDYNGVDTFGYFYEDGNFYWRNHLEWNQPISGSALISQPYGAYVLATTWR